MSLTDHRGPTVITSDLSKISLLFVHRVVAGIGCVLTFGFPWTPPWISWCPLRISSRPVRTLPGSTEITRQSGRSTAHEHSQAGVSWIASPDTGLHPAVVTITTVWSPLVITGAPDATAIDWSGTTTVGTCAMNKTCQIR